MWKSSSVQLYCNITDMAKLYVIIVILLCYYSPFITLIIVYYYIVSRIKYPIVMYLFMLLSFKYYDTFSKKERRISLSKSTPVSILCD